MNKKFRQKAIAEIITKKSVFTLSDMMKALKQKKCRVNISTLSRDFNEMGVVKTVEGYQILNKVDGQAEILASQVIMLQQMITGVNSANNIVVITTITGGAQAVARMLDVSCSSDILGTVAGDDTILCICKSNTSAVQFVKMISNKIEGS